MKTPQLPKRRRFSRITASGVFFALTLCGAAVYAATQAGPIILLDVQRKDGTPSADHDSGGGKGSTSTSYDVNYTIKLTDSSAVPSGDLTVEYHIYMKDSDSDNGINTSTYSDTTSTQSVTVDAKSSKDIALPAVKHNTKTQAGTSSKDKKTGIIKTTGGTSSSSGPLGIYVVVKSGDKVIVERELPTGVKKQAEAMIQAQLKRDGQGAKNN